MKDTLKSVSFFVSAQEDLLCLWRGLKGLSGCTEQDGRAKRDKAPCGQWLQGTFLDRASVFQVGGSAGLHTLPGDG